MGKDAAWLVLTIIFSFTLSFAIGANDAANALATNYGAKALAMPKLLAMGGIAVFIGSMFLSSEVAATLTKKIIPGIRDEPTDAQNLMMFSVCIASFITLIVASWLKMPISGTHTVVGSLLGGGIVVVGIEGLSGKKLVKIVASWFISPVTAGAISFGLMYGVCGLTLNNETLSFGARI